MKNAENRKTYRVKCKKPICTQISIVKVNNNAVTTGTGIICLEDISAGGLRFLSGLNMPPGDALTIEFRLEIEREIFAFYGFILRKEELGQNTFRYGVKFLNDISENHGPVEKLNELITKGEYGKSRFCLRNAAECFKRLKEKKDRSLYKRYKKIGDQVQLMVYIGKSGRGPVAPEWEQVSISSISPKGIEFNSGFKLPEFKDNMQQFKIIAEDKTISSKGQVLGIEDLHNGKYKYTIKVNISETNKIIIEAALNSESGAFQKGKSVAQESSIEKHNDENKDKRKFEWWG
ncbi:MAG: PilZ domain-containing protein [Bacillota bacterium]|nr:PilZ domain-containing protein [Bacillota bacterium]